MNKKIYMMYFGKKVLIHEVIANIDIQNVSMFNLEQTLGQSGMVWISIVQKNYFSKNGWSRVERNH